MNKEDLYLPSSPYLYVIGTSVSAATDFAWSLAQHDSLRVVVRFLRGKKMTRVSSLFDEFAAALQFPYYFGENWNAFDECITDLEWLSGDVYILVITDSKALLSEQNGEQLDALTNILESAGNEWGQPVETSEAWSRPAIAFHVIFQCDESDKQEVISRLNSVNASFRELRLQEA
jgi:RNAse (barnase) inhibitor barstar